MTAQDVVTATLRGNFPMAETVLRDLAKAGYVLTKLDTPYAILDGVQHFSDGSTAGEVAGGNGIVYGYDWEWTPDQAIEVARQWLSAANAAQNPSHTYCNKCGSGWIGEHDCGRK